MKIRYNVTAKRLGFEYDEKIGDFVKVGIARSEDATIEPIGWVKIRDANGKLIVWINYADLC